MSIRSRFGLEALFAAIIAGVVGNSLLQGVDWSVNFAVWIASLAILGTVLYHRGKAVGAVFSTRSAILMAGVALLFAAAFVWRDSPGVRTANLIAVIAALGIPLVNRTPFVTLGSWNDYSSRLIGRWLSLPGDAVKLCANDVEWNVVGGSLKRWNMAAISRGFLLAAPILLVFGGLFAMADAGFEKLVSPKLGFDFETTILNCFGIIGFTIVAAGLFRRFFLPADPTAPPVVKPSHLGATEWSIALGLLNLMFVVFVGLQLKHFTSSIQSVASQDGLSVAEYVRRGFFELVIAAGLLLPILLTAYSDLARSEKSIRLYRGLTGGLVGMMFVVILSALHRMWLHVQLHGLTELRIYSSVFLGWLCLVFAWYMFTVWGKAPRRFAFGAAVAGFAAIFTLNLMNPDSLIARTNLRAADCDYSYVASLSADAVPATLKHLKTAPTAVQAQLKKGLNERWSKADPDWRTWNIARGQAYALIFAPHKVAAKEPRPTNSESP